ncbi:hypothetical protein GYMLUDRAFT_225410 [Collybiopsis luxurians FD-317 M1]|uniref:Unplaced genomic scaffold GYMLUscaffold_24, whole genome shotgun sequence n=1 Tax=Collybiopsis luxurians FD-317 M1 TaxID=944289 RepID=A0A0D0CF36_9AGAR|nr:hypothetical protein GYMLUDRAFT_225410 [Collybiopsis luxurians FD-317 M1]
MASPEVATILTGLQEIQVTDQQTLPSGAAFPFVASPSISESNSEGPQTISDWVKLGREWSSSGSLQQALDKHGAIVLRDLPVESAKDFSDFLHSFGWTPHEDVGNPVKRKVLAKNVAKANEGPPDLYIAAHSEFGISSIFPSHICFWGSVVPEEGGETPISSGAVLLQRLQEEAPEFVKNLLEKVLFGVTYTIYHPPTQLSGNANGNGVRAAWGSKIEPGDDDETAKRKIEQEIQRISPETTWDWQADGGLFTKQRVPAFRKHPNTGAEVVFGNISSYYVGSRMLGTLEPPYLTPTGFYKPPPMYGDDTPIPLEYLRLLLAIIEETRALFKWKKNDVMIIDNLSTQHSRVPWSKGQREILASLWNSGIEKHCHPISHL